MNRRMIWKFPVAPRLIVMPQGAEILTVQIQEGVPCIWALVDPNAEKEERYFDVYGTGEQVNRGMGVKRSYIGTFQQPPFVWHLFERQ